jgi:hypothetical protein
VPEHRSLQQPQQYRQQKHPQQQYPQQKYPQQKHPQQKHPQPMFPCLRSQVVASSYPCLPDRMQLVAASLQFLPARSLAA